MLSAKRSSSAWVSPVDPMQIFKDDKGGLVQAFAHDDALDRVECAPTLNQRIHLRQRIGTS